MLGAGTENGSEVDEGFGQCILGEELRKVKLLSLKNRLRRDLIILYSD